MSRLHGLRVALRSLVRRTRVEAELDEEVQYHLERQIQEGLKAGLTPEQARDAALRAMGPIDKSKEECRDLRSGSLVSEFLSDLRYAGRALRRSPGFAVLAIAIMALGIGANTAVFSVVNGVLLKPLPYQGADRIVTLRTAFLVAGGTQGQVAIANYRDWRDQSSSFEAMATYRGGESPVSPGTAAEYGRLATVDAQFFRVFAVEPLIGRTFTPEETVPDNEQRTAVISHAYWQSRFGGAADILQRTIRVGARVHPIVGVMPAGFHFPSRDRYLGSPNDEPDQPHRTQFLCCGATQTARVARTGAGRADHDCRAPRAAVPGQQQRAWRGRRASAGRARGRRASDALPPVGCRGCGAVDRLCEHRHAAPGQGDDPHARDCCSHGARRQARPDRQAIDHREPAARACRRRCRKPARPLGRARAGRAESG